MLPDNILPFKTTIVDEYGRIGVGTEYRGHTILARFADADITKPVLETGRVNVGRGFKGRECDVYVMRKE